MSSQLPPEEQPKIKGKYHALTTEQRQLMLQYGFLPKEIKEFDNNLTTVWESDYFQDMIRSRRRWVVALKANDWTTKDIYKKLRRYYRISKGRSPWDFFRMEYAAMLQKPALSRSKFQDFYDIRKQTSATLGRAYGRIQAARKSAYRGLPGLPRRKG